MVKWRGRMKEYRSIELVRYRRTWSVKCGWRRRWKWRVNGAVGAMEEEEEKEVGIKEYR